MSVLALPRRGLSRRAALAVRAHAAAGTLWLAITVGLIALLVGRIAFVGADSLWLAALGDHVVHHGIPDGIPFAAARTGHWANTLVLAEVIFYLIEHTFGDGGLIAAQTLAVGAGLGLLAADARRRGATAAAVCVVLVLVFAGALAALTVARVQLFSLVMFPAALGLLRADFRKPGARIWLMLPLLALWSNLHGAAVLGLALLYPYLLFARWFEVREARLQTAALAVLAPVGLCLTPAGLRTPSYYHGLLANVAAQRGVGMWAPLGSGTLDLLLIAVAVLLALMMLRGRTLRLWEAAVLAILAVATIKASRDGVWLLFALAAPAAQGLSRTAAAVDSSAARKPPVTERATPNRDFIGLLPLLLAASLLLLISDVSRWSTLRPSTPSQIRTALSYAHGSPILADDLPGERIALAGGHIWAGNPIDAFDTPTQKLYLDFIAGDPDGAPALSEPGVRVALIGLHSATAALISRDHSYRLVAKDDGYGVFVR